MPFHEIDITTLEDPRAELARLTGGAFATPTVVIEEEARVGFDPSWMSERLGLGSSQAGPQGTCTGKAT